MCNAACFFPVPSTYTSPIPKRIDMEGSRGWLHGLGNVMIDIIPIQCNNRCNIMIITMDMYASDTAVLLHDASKPQKLVEL
jgi:hypothetical protein